MSAGLLRCDPFAQGPHPDTSNQPTVTLLLALMQNSPPEKFGKYEVIREIGKGGFGVVYEGHDPILKRSVAIKTCSSDDEGLRLRFQREAEIVASLQHPNITTIHDLGVENGVPYIVQEYLSGNDLAAVISSRRPLPLGRKLQILTAISRGLEQAHKRGVIHRDIKPGNVRLLDDGSVKVMDFGIAKLANAGDVQLTQTGMMIGTAAYLAPEQVSDVEVDHRCDIFSFGVLGYELFSYKRPFSGTTISSLLYKINHDRHESLMTVMPEIPAHLSKLLDDCLSKDPDGRPNTFTDVLQRIAGDTGVAPTKLSSSGKTGPADTTRLVKPSITDEHMASPEALAPGPAALAQTARSATPVPTANDLQATVIESAQIQAETDGTIGEVRMTESSMSQMFSKASRPSVLAVAAMALVAVGAVWFGLARSAGVDTTSGTDRTSPNEETAGSTASELSVADAEREQVDASTSPVPGQPGVVETPPTSVADAKPTPSEPRSEQAQTSQAATPRAQTPRAQTPQARASQVQSPQTQTPQAQTPQVQSPDLAPEPRPQPVRTPPVRTEAIPSQVARAAPLAVETARAGAVTESAGTRSAAESPKPAAVVQSPPLQSIANEPKGTEQNVTPAKAKPKPVEAVEAKAVTPVDPRPALERVLDSYANAISAMDGRALRAIWPSLSARQFGRIESSFENAQAMEVKISRCVFDVGLGASTASATCRVARSITPKAGSRQNNVVTRTIQFRKVGGRWVLESI